MPTIDPSNSPKICPAQNFDPHPDTPVIHDGESRDNNPLKFIDPRPGLSNTTNYVPGEWSGGVGELTIKFYDTGARGKIYDNGLNQICVMVTVQPLGSNGGPLLYSNELATAVFNATQLIDLKKNPLFWSGGWSGGDGKSWCYTDQENDFVTGGALGRAPINLSMGPGGDRGQILFGWYVMCPSTARDKTIAIAVSVAAPTSGTVDSTGGSSGGDGKPIPVSTVSIQTLTYIDYTQDKVKTDYLDGGFVSTPYGDNALRHFIFSIKDPYFLIKKVQYLDGSATPTINLPNPGQSDGGIGCWYSNYHHYGNSNSSNWAVNWYWGYMWPLNGGPQTTYYGPADGQGWRGYNCTITVNTRPDALNFTALESWRWGTSVQNLRTWYASCQFIMYDQFGNKGTFSATQTSEDGITGWRIGVFEGIHGGKGGGNWPP